jgi:hypothetical protein
MTLELEAEWTLRGATAGWWRERGFLRSVFTAMQQAGLDLPLRFFGPLIGDPVEFASLDELAAHPDAPDLLDEDDVFLATEQWALDGSWIRLSVDQDEDTLTVKVCLHPDSASHLGPSAETTVQAFATRLAGALPGTADGGVLELSGALGASPSSRPPRVTEAPSPMRDFDTPEDLTAGLSWTAEYDSFNQRYQEVYFGITLWRDGEATSRFMVVVDEVLGDWDGNDRHYDAAQAREAYRQRLAAAAASGTGNCEHGTDRFPGAG